MEELNGLPEQPAIPAPAGRERFSFVRRLFGRPRLSWPLVILILLLITSHSTLVLLGQPRAYWTDSGEAFYGVTLIESVLSIGPYHFAALVAGYLVLVALLLRLLTRSVALVLWFMLAFVHLKDAVSWSRCGFEFYAYVADCDPVGLAISLISSLILGLALAISLSSRPTSAGARRNLRRVTAGIACLWLLFLGYSVVRAVDHALTGWVAVPVDVVPAARISAAVAYDSGRQRAVLFSGAIEWFEDDTGLYALDTWEWDGERWEQKFPADRPPARMEHAMAYDPVRGVTVLYGGRDDNVLIDDIWEWDGTNWHERNPVERPPARCCHQMWYDPGRESVVVYGGYDLSATFFNDAWEWDGESWRQIELELDSPVAAGYTAAYEPENEYVVALLSGFPSGTWILEGDRWNDLQPALEPSERSGTRMVYDARQRQIVLFGGWTSAALLNDTWVFDGNEWREVTVPAGPEARWGHILFFDEVRGRVMLFGGLAGTNFRNDLWEFYMPD